MYKIWTQEEIQKLKENFHLPNSELSLILNRSIDGIKTKAKLLKLKKDRVISIGSVYYGLRLIDKPFSYYINGIKRTFGVFKCDCGRLVEKRLDNVLSGKTQYCGNCNKGK